MSHSLSTRRALGITSTSLLFASLLALQPACSSDEPGPSATGGSSTGGSSTGGSSTGGSSTGGSSTGGSSTGGSSTGGSSTGGSATGGSTTGGLASGGSSTGGSAAGGSTTGGAASGGMTGGGGATTAGAVGNGGAASGGMAGANSAGKSGGSAGGGTAGSGTGGAGGGSGGKTAIANIMPTTGNQLSGTATFTQNGQAVTLVIQVSNCPAGSHASHIHANKNCGNNGLDAGDHWVPQGEVIPDIVCGSDGKGTAMVTPPNGTWTIGGGSADVTAHAIIVHAGNNANPGGRLACGVINAP